MQLSSTGEIEICGTQDKSHEGEKQHPASPPMFAQVDTNDTGETSAHGPHNEPQGPGFGDEAISARAEETSAVATPTPATHSSERTDGFTKSTPRIFIGFQSA